MSSSILALSTVVPTHFLPQDKIAEMMVDLLELQDAAAMRLRKLYQNSAIKKRHTVVPDFIHHRDQWSFWGTDFPRQAPAMGARNTIYKREAPLLAEKAARLALEEWDGNVNDITHVISVSCTGVVAPGIEFGLINALGLSRTVARLGINLMGCFGAFKGLAVAHTFAKENPHHRVLLVCTELCSLHMQINRQPDNIIANALFADGASALVVGCNPHDNERPLWNIERHASLALDQSLDQMTWEACDTGFQMTLSQKVPDVLEEQILPFVQQLLGENIKPSDCDWPLHPGGKAILQGIERRLGLQPNQTQAAWQTLENYGNMSSATFPFVLDALRKQTQRRKWAVGVGFGPGLSMEGILLRNPLD